MSAVRTQLSSDRWRSLPSLVSDRAATMRRPLIPLPMREAAILDWRLHRLTGTPGLHRAG